MNPSPEKECLSCGKLLRGRTDKKFCDDYCRNNYNNQLKSDQNNLVRNINNALRKNRRLLEAYIPDGASVKTLRREQMVLDGFNFQYFTHTYENQKGQLYRFCYDHGYLFLDDDRILVVYQKEK